jgi:hypothetical protein
VVATTDPATLPKLTSWYLLTNLARPAGRRAQQAQLAEIAGPGGADVGLARYRSDGRLDRSFGVSGVVITSVSPTTDEVGGLALQADGRLLVAGTTVVSQSIGFFVARYLSA